MASPTAFPDAQGQNNIDRNVRQYKDLDLFFAKTQASKDVRKVTDIAAVKRSVRNLVLLNHYENFEPRVRLISVRADPNLDRNEYEVTIEFFVVNAPTELVDLTVFLEVLR
jgi:phage baseplate assembly protein W